MDALSRLRGFVGVAFLLALLAGCTYPFSVDMRREANRDLTPSRIIDAPSEYLGDTIIWGGIIQWVRNTEEGLEVQVLQTPLQWNESPDTKVAEGEFIAVIAEAPDPDAFQKGKRITVGGEIIGERTEDGKIMKYRYPVILAREIHLWDKKRNWWEPRSSSGWLWNLFGSDPQTADHYSWEKRVW